MSLFLFSIASDPVCYLSDEECGITPEMHQELIDKGEDSPISARRAAEKRGRRREGVIFVSPNAS
jgi:hypothetical protein